MKAIATARDLLIMTLTLYGEGRGESVEGKIAIVHTIINRAIVAREYFVKNRKRHPNFGAGGYDEVCLDPYEFSCWNKGDPNSDNLVSMRDKGWDALMSDATFVECLAAVLTAMRTKDSVMGATHYHTVTLGFPKSWGAVQKPCITIGNHHFYNTVR